jgi:hypothetical protein
MFSVSDVRDELNRDLYVFNSRRQDIQWVLAEYTRTLTQDTFFHVLSNLGSIVQVRGKTPTRSQALLVFP